jgi:hypothetical protein
MSSGWARRPDSDFERLEDDPDVFVTPDLLYHTHSRTKTPTIQMKESRELLLELAVATEPKSETTLSKLTSIDRHTIRTYCRRFLESDLIEWNYVNRGRLTEKLHKLTPLGKAFALSISIEDNKLSTRDRKRLLTDYVWSKKPISPIYPVRAIGPRFLHYLLERGQYDILYAWVSYTIEYLRNNPRPHFWSLTWLTFQKDLKDTELRKTLKCLEEFSKTLPSDQKTIFEFLVDEFQPTPLREKRRLLGTPDLAQIFKMHPELKLQISHLKDEPNFQTVRGSVIGLDIDLELVKKKSPLKLKHMGGGVYKASEEGNEVTRRAQ